MSSSAATPVSEDDTYILARDVNASLCLNSQHYLWQQELGFNIHPSIPTVPRRVADVATGTGAWLLEVSPAHPTAMCDGFDISLAQVPPAVWLPQNVKFSKWNMFKAPPSDLVRAYGLVHIRLVANVVQDQDLGPPLRHLLSLLKPGGFLEREEIDINKSSVAHAEGDSGESEAVRKMNGLMRSHSSSRVVRDLVGSMEDGGFEQVTMYRIQQITSLVKFTTDCAAASFGEIASRLGEKGERRDVFEKMMKEVGHETGQGAVQVAPKVGFVGQKPRTSHS